MIILIIKTIFFFIFLSIFLGYLLTYISEIYKIDVDPVIEEINNVLPQSQCGQCGYVNCNLYAQAIIIEKEKINKCIPGGNTIIKILSNILNIDYSKSNHLDYIDHKSIMDHRFVAWIDESNCVGCSKCFYICPVDSIIGSNNLSHTVLSKFCTGCNLCVEICPTDCIQLRKIEQ